MILCPSCRMTLHKRSFMSDFNRLALVCPECGKLWVVPWPFDPALSLKPFAVTDQETINRALDGMRV